MDNISPVALPVHTKIKHETTAEQEAQEVKTQDVRST